MEYQTIQETVHDGFNICQRHSSALQNNRIENKKNRRKVRDCKPRKRELTRCCYRVFFMNKIINAAR